MCLLLCSSVIRIACKINLSLTIKFQKNTRKRSANNKVKSTFTLVEFYSDS